jgi:hypothetical protein
VRACIPSPLHLELSPSLHPLSHISPVSSSTPPFLPPPAPFTFWALVKFCSFCFLPSLASRLSFVPLPIHISTLPLPFQTIFIFNDFFATYSPSLQSHKHLLPHFFREYIGLLSLPVCLLNLLVQHQNMYSTEHYTNSTPLQTKPMTLQWLDWNYHPPSPIFMESVISACTAGKRNFIVHPTPLPYILPSLQHTADTAPPPPPHFHMFYYQLFYLS